jgi:hypothetical protein
MALVPRVVGSVAREGGFRSGSLKKTWISNLTIILLSVSVALVAGEIALRVLGQCPPPTCPPVNIVPDYYQGYEAYGYGLIPSRTTTYVYPQDGGRELSLNSNSLGFRSSRELNEPDERTRIVVVGDSFVFGQGVEEEERFTNVLEQLRPDWRVDNLGMTGYGVGLMLRALESVGLDCSPDLVIFSIYTDDIRRVRPYYSGLGFATPRYEIEGDRLVSVPYPSLRAWDHLRVYQGLRRVYWRYSKAKYRITEAILDRFLELQIEHSFAPVVLFLPGRSDEKIDVERRTWLRDYAATRNVPFLDLTAALHARPVDSVFIEGNWHLNATGHRIVATELLEFFEQCSVLDGARQDCPPATGSRRFTSRKP